VSPKKSPKNDGDGAPRLVLLDGHGIIHRAYNAFREPLTVRKTGEVVTAVFGFANSLLTVIEQLKPTHVAVALDPRGPTFRHEKDESYKATRFDALKLRVGGAIEALSAPDEYKEALAEAVAPAASPDEMRKGIAAAVEELGVPESVKRELLKSMQPLDRLREIGQQSARVEDLINAFNLPIYRVDGYEADDVLGTLAMQAQEAGIETYLVTLDSDIVQLITDHVKVFMMRPYQRDTIVYDAAKAFERYGFAPAQMADFKGLKGDTSDNIPGVPGIGDKTAVKLIDQFGSIEEVYARIDEVTPEKLRENLRAHEADARHSKEMATIDRDAPVTLELDACRLSHYNRDAVIELFRDLEFKSLVPRLPEPPAPEGNGHRAAAAPAAVADQDYGTVFMEKDLDALAKQLTKAKAFTFAAQAAGNHALRAALVGISVSWAPGQAAYVPVGHRPGLGDPEQLPLETVAAKLGPIFADERIEKVGHGTKSNMEVLHNHGIEVRGVAFDTLLASYLLGESGSTESARPGGGSLGLKWTVSKLLNIEMKEIEEVIGKGAKQLSLSDVSAEQAAPYACAEADMAGRLRPLLEAELKDHELWPLFDEIEMPLVAVLARMEEAGVAVDTDALREMSRGLTEQIARLEQQAYDAVGHEFNLGSPLQLSQVLFEELALPKTRKTKQGYTTDATALEGLRGAHAVIDILLEWRQITKLKSTYLDSLPALVHPKTGRIHTNFNQTVAATGRLSSQDPNLQNIPVRTELGNAIRRCFVARDYGPDPVLLAADYSQIELRILAHLSQDERLIEAFRQDEDIHAATASSVFGVEIEDVTAEQRRRAKVFNFGVLYGLSEFGLSTREGISREEAAGFIDTYFAKYPKVREWRESVIKSCRELGYAETMVGRKRLVPEIRSSNFQVRAAAERIAVNMPAQGTASDIIKIAMNTIDAELTERRLTTKMVLQVHDELIFEGPAKERDALQEMVLRIMPQSLELAVPLKVDVKVGKNWGELEVMPAVASAGG
jgi:DNA polymerase-1